MEENKIIFTNEDGEKDEFYVVEETMLNNVKYLLVCDSMEDETDAFILKDLSAPEDTEAVYEFVEDDNELEALADIFAELLDDEELI
ncbi:MAG: DUF1292 domain-containing protein [Lachnospiraceae bacterium]|nr:DUF1292 domain-containing protein [Lachnospiraceae bacterium]